MALESTLTIAKLHDLHPPDDPSDPHRICVMGEGAWASDGPPDVFLQKLQHFGEKGYCRCIHNRIPLIVSSLIKKLMRPKRVILAEPSYVYFSGKKKQGYLLEESIFSTILTGQRTYRNILPRKISSIKEFAFLVQNPLRSPNLALVNYKDLQQLDTQPSNAIFTATKGDVVGGARRGRVRGSPHPRIRMPVFQAAWLI